MNARIVRRGAKEALAKASAAYERSAHDVCDLADVVAKYATPSGEDFTIDGAALCDLRSALDAYRLNRAAFLVASARCSETIGVEAPDASQAPR